jgi:branched-chain amino acid transport system permease protein
MSDYVFYLLLGVGAGAIIAGLGLGLVVVHEGSGVVNFAQGAMATWVAYVYADLRNGAYPFPIPGLPARYHFGGSWTGDVGLAWALTGALLTAALLGAVVYLLVFRRLRRAPALAKVVAGVGLVIMLLTLVERRFESGSSIRVAPILPREPVRITDDIVVPRDGLWLAAIVIALGAALWAASRFTRLGLLTRAAAENEKGAVLLGRSPDVPAAASWVLASVLCGLVAVLAAPMLQLGSGVYTFGYLVPALGAALLGRFRSIGVTIAAGLAIGMVQSTFTKLQGDLPWFPEYGAREGLPFLVIIATMALRGGGLPERGAVDAWRLPAAPAVRLRGVSLLVPAVAAAALLWAGPLWRGALMTSIIGTVMALSFVVLSGFAGQTSLAQSAFAGVAGFALAKFATEWGIPFPIAPLLAVAVATLFGLALGLPALRLRGTDLAIVTLAGGVAITEFVFKNPRYVGDASTGGAQVPNPELFGWDLGLVLGTSSSRSVFGLFLLLVATLLVVLVANLRRSATGRRILAVRSNERAAAAAGVHVAGTKLVAFTISAALAGVAGCLTAYRFGTVSDASFGVMASLTALAFAYLGGVGTVGGAMVAGLLVPSGVVFFGLSRVSGEVGPWDAFIGGVLLVGMAVLQPEGIAGAWRSRRGRRRPARPSADVAAPVTVAGALT